MRIFTTLFFACLTFISFSQLISITPSNGGAEDEITLIFDASQGNKELVGASKVYMHTGVVTDNPNGTAWKYVKGNWGTDDGIGLMTKVQGSTDKWQIKFSPTLRAYFGVPVSEDIYRISCVFRNADGSKKGTAAPGQYGWGTVASNQDYYVNLNTSNFIFFSSPQINESFNYAGDKLNIKAETSTNANISLLLDEGSGYVNVADVIGVKALNYEYNINQSVNLKMKAVADFNGTLLEKEQSINIIVIEDGEVEDLPAGLKKGVNVIDSNSVTLVLLAPGKTYVYAVGDFNNWNVTSDYQMKKTPDGKYFWLTIPDLDVNKDYVYQYWIDGNIKVADPYTTQVADPWNDQYIEDTVFPNLPDYDKTNNGIASVFKINSEKYNWTSNEISWQKPDVNHLTIYELHIRDFLASHSLKDLTDTIQYLKRIGVQAIELMPVNEFEGNDSWGYNPSFYFAVDKYYGTPNDLKQFIDVAHQNGMAVIMDIVLNHSYGQSPLVQMYFDNVAGKPSANNPWYNREYVGQYQWGYDFNHESQYTKDFIDEVNKYWLEEFHFDGFRFDFTKGFTNYAPNNNVDGFDQSRINILKRMADEIWKVDEKAYIILEHWGQNSEEIQLANHGLKMWRNKTYDFVPATVGNITGSFTNNDATSHITFLDSHDERRIAEWCLADGRSNGSYNIKNKEVMYERVKMAAAFMFLSPGPKMIWQFDELGYDINIDFNGRIGKKPLPWGSNSLMYYEDEYRQQIYTTYSKLLELRSKLDPAKLAASSKQHALSGDVRRLTYNTSDIDMTLIGNFALSDKSIDARFTQTGWWYEYFSGDSINITTISANITSLKAGEWRIYTNKKLSNGLDGVVEVYSNPVTINPNPFPEDGQVYIRFDAKKAFSKNTNGLVGANKIYLHSGVILTKANNNNLTHIVGNNVDDGIGLMNEVGDDVWEIIIKPREYYNIAENDHIYKIGMWFRDENNVNLGYGFRNSIIYGDAISNEPIVEIIPPAFEADDEIKLVFNARQGNRELVGASKIYMHSGVGTVNTTNPAASAWNKVVGNWGADDGIGEMKKVSGETDKWEVNFVPEDYYKLTGTEFPFWIAAVFRNETGTAKGTATAGPILNGFVAANQDFFIQNQFTVDVEDLFNKEDVIIYPNPTQDWLSFKNVKVESQLMIFDINGKVVLESFIRNNDIVNIEFLEKGIYTFLLLKDNHKISGKLIKM